MRISDDKEFNVWVAGSLGKMREVRVMIMIKFNLQVCSPAPAIHTMTITDLPTKKLL